MAKPCGTKTAFGKLTLSYPDTNYRWFVVLVRGQYEKKAEQYLRRLGIEVFLPLQKEVRYWSDRRKVIEVPLFPSYIFVNVNTSNYYQVLGCSFMLKFVCFNGRPVPVPNEQLNIVKELIRSETDFVAIKNSNKIGDQVIFQHGPLANYKGEVKLHAGKNQVVISLDCIGYALLIKTSAEYIMVAETL